MAAPDTDVLKIARPEPPAYLHGFAPAPELRDWMHKTFIDGYGPLVNEDHQHLKCADIGVLWTSIANARGMNQIVGTAEMPMSKGGWSGARERFQLRQWFGSEPKFLITIYAPYAEECHDLSLCALIEHELYHCAQARDPFGAPKFTKFGSPVFAMRGHDVEEHIGIMRRYGINGCAGQSRKFVEYSMKTPEIGAADIAGVCGTCGR